MIAVGYTTAPRDRPTLADSVKSIREQGGYEGRIVVFAEPGSATREVFVHDTGPFMAIANRVPLGALRNWVAGLRFLVTQTTEPWLMICQDDITWAERAFVALHAELDVMASLERAGGYSLFLPVRMAKLCERSMGSELPHGWLQSGMQNGNKMWGAQCLLFARRQAMKLLSDPVLRSYTDDPQYTKNIDAIVAHAINARGERIYWRNPCLVDHVLGEANSSLGNKDSRPNLRTRHFTGTP